MSDEDASGGAFDMSSTFVHLDAGPGAFRLPDFAWTQEYLDSYHARFASNGPGRLVSVIDQHATWDGWERHPRGDELVVLLSGRVDVVQDTAEGTRIVELEPGLAMINPAGVWHTARVHEPGRALFITPGEGTEFRPLSDATD